MNSFVCSCSAAHHPVLRCTACAAPPQLLLPLPTASWIINCQLQRLASCHQAHMHGAHSAARPRASAAHSAPSHSASPPTESALTQKRQGLSGRQLFTGGQNEIWDEGVNPAHSTLLTFTMYLLAAMRAASRASEEMCSFSQLQGQSGGEWERLMRGSAGTAQPGEHACTEAMRSLRLLCLAAATTQVSTALQAAEHCLPDQHAPLRRATSSSMLPLQACRCCLSCCAPAGLPTVPRPPQLC